MRRTILSLLVLVAAGGSLLAQATWSGIADRIDRLLDDAVAAYERGNPEETIGLVNEAYFSLYENEGMERAVLSYISSRRASLVEYQFSLVKKKARDGEAPQEVHRAAADLEAMLREDSSRLDGARRGPAQTFLASFVILLREGVEAILVLAAIVAYLVKSGNRRRSRVVYLAALAALGASLLTAVALRAVLGLQGASREIIEGVTVLVAVGVLFFVSHWMLGKAESRAWQGYIREKVSGSMGRGSALGLAAAAFLAVYREGAETVLFYQALVSGGSVDLPMVWVGVGTACLVLAAVFLVVRYGSIRLPLRPFFLGSSALMYLLAIVFAGAGVRELQEADVVGSTAIPGLPSVDLLGIYPTWETLAPQILLVLLAFGAIAFYRLRARGRQAATPGSQS